MIYDALKIGLIILGIIILVSLIVGIQVVVLKFAVGLIGYKITYLQSFGAILILDIVGKFFTRTIKNGK